MAVVVAARIEVVALAAVVQDKVVAAAAVQTVAVAAVVDPSWGLLAVMELDSPQQKMWGAAAAAAVGCSCWGLKEEYRPLVLVLLEGAAAAADSL